jgi:hypothetical protein
MPIEIRELHIKLNVNQPGREQQATPAGGGGEAAANEKKQAIIAECVEQVLNILKKQKER